MASDAATTQDRRAAENAARWRSVSAGWRRWHPQLAAWWEPTTDLMVARAGLRPGQAVLDLASGTGEPALTIARLVAPGGTVVATDLVHAMLAVAAELGAARSIANLRLLATDATDLPFADASFDRVTCRFGLMFFPDPARALREVRRVLRPRGRVVLTTWGATEEQTFSTSTVGVLQRHLPATPQPPRPFDTPEMVGAALREAGLAARVEAVTTDLSFPGRPADFVAWWRAAQVSFEALLSRIPDGQRAAALDEVLAAVGQYDDGHQLAFPSPVFVAVGDR